MAKKTVSETYGKHNERELKALEPIISKIESLEEEFIAMTDVALRAKTTEFKTRLKAGETMNDILPEAFAAAREACDRVLGLRPFRVQLMGGIVLHQGRIAEMKTGEGKTLVAVLAAYLNALAGDGVHIVTANGYLAQRDCEWMGKVYRFMNMSVGLIVHGMTSDERRVAYKSDITYAAENEIVFDYLRDNMALYKRDLVQRGHKFAIIDDIDSILIDEARTPLIISGQGDEDVDMYIWVNEFVATLRKRVIATAGEYLQGDETLGSDYIVDEKERTVTLTEQGVAKAEQRFGIDNLADPVNGTLSRLINKAIQAHGLMRREVDYLVMDGEGVMVDEIKGRIMPGRRYSEGLHQAIEAKEYVHVARESKSYATITFKNYFRLYDKLSGMTGTAFTEAEEFRAIYRLNIVGIPTNRPLIRIDNGDVVYKNEAGKYRAVIEQIETCNKKGQPILVGTLTIEKSELLSSMLKNRGVRHYVLNAKFHREEAEIIAQAGKVGAVTIATNMAGRGTDIMLGGNPEYMAKNDMRNAGLTDELIAEATGYAETDDEEIIAARKMYAEKLKKHRGTTSAEAEKVRKAGGLFILGTERYDARRIDNQLRGRAGRQGDPGETRFYIALTDDIMKRFGSERIMGMMESLGLEEDMPIDRKMLSNAIESAQRRVESRNFKLRRSLFEYDDVMDQQRTLVYSQRRRVLSGEDLTRTIQSMISETIDTIINEKLGDKVRVEEQTQLAEVLKPFEALFLDKRQIRFPQSGLDKDELAEMLERIAEVKYAAKEKELGTAQGSDIPLMRELERVVMLRVVDEQWNNHLEAMEKLREELRTQQNPLPIYKYKYESHKDFEDMIKKIKKEVVRRLYVVRIRKPDEN